MKRVAFILKVREEMIEEYKQQHQNVWPEMRDALSRTGWHNYSLFICDDGLLFGYFETEKDFETALSGMEKEPINAKWQKEMMPFFEALGDKRADESMLQLVEVFHLD
jgi:L-rhamnose mutarotase